jgi:hypothetical protein
MSVSDHDQDRQTVLDAFDKQIGWCEKLGSPFTARLLTILRDDIAAGGASAEMVLGWPGDPVADALALRMAGALHALALTGSAAALVPCYPPSAAPVERLRPVVLDVVREHQSAIRAFLVSPPQTNEVGRSGVLVGGFLEIAKETGLPLRCLEIGASAGLNTIWDRYHYRLGAVGWGDPPSQSISKTPPSASASEPTSGPISASACPVWKAPSTSHAPTVQESIRPTPLTGSEQSYANRPRRARRSSTIPSCGNTCRQRLRRASARTWTRPAAARPALRLWPGCASSC